MFDKEETKLAPKKLAAISIDIAPNSAVVANESDALLQVPAVKETVEPTGDDAVTVTIGYNVKPDCEVQFEDWFHEISRTAATRVEGHRGALLIATPDHVRKRISKPLTHVIMFQFDTKSTCKSGQITLPGMSWSIGFARPCRFVFDRSTSCKLR